jgi:hypothetical protein
MGAIGSAADMGSSHEGRTKVNAELDDSDPEPEHSAVSEFNPKLLPRNIAVKRSEYLWWWDCEQLWFRRDTATLSFMRVKQYE